MTTMLVERCFQMLPPLYLDEYLKKKVILKNWKSAACEYMTFSVEIVFIQTHDSIILGRAR